MRLGIVAILCLVASPSFAPADAEMESRNLFHALKGATEAFDDALANVDRNPEKARRELMTQVAPVIRSAERHWRNELNAQIDHEPWYQFMMCRESAKHLRDMSGTYIAFLSGRIKRPQLELRRFWFRQNYSQCQLNLGIEPTYPYED